MKKLLLSTVLLTLLSTPSLAASWSKTDVALQGVTTTTFALDWLQTRDIKHHKDVEELNLFLPHSPSNNQIDAYFSASILGHALVSHYLPDFVILCGGSEASAKLSRTIWQSIWIGIETGVVYNNYSIGLRTKF